jgi:hypothetical protein
MSQPTKHGENIANQIQGSDAYDDSGEMTLADVWLIVDNLHTHFLNTGRDNTMLERWMRELETIDEELPGSCL